MNSIHLIGRVGRDPEVKYLHGGKTVVNFSIATGYGDYTIWHNCEAWDKTADIISKNVKSGDQIGIDGQLRYDEWTDKDTGKKRRAAKVNAFQIHFTGRKDDKPTESPVSNVPGDDEDDGLPF